MEAQFPILCIETSSRDRSEIAVGKKNRQSSNITWEKKTLNANVSQGEQLALCVGRVLKKSRVNLTDLKQIAVSSGPGSFTGIRIGLGLAMGMAVSRDLPVTPVPSLLTMAMGALEFFADQSLVYLPLIAAQKGKLSGCLYQFENRKALTLTSSKNCSVTEWVELVKSLSLGKTVVIFGGGFTQYKVDFTQQLKSQSIPNRLLAANSPFHYPRAHMLVEALEQMDSEEKTDLIYPGTIAGGISDDSWVRSGT